MKQHQTPHLALRKRSASSCFIRWLFHGREIDLWSIPALHSPLPGVIMIGAGRKHDL